MASVSRVATTIVLVRHGVTDWNRERRFQGRADIPLNADGVAQAHELAERLEGEELSLAYASPLRRALETAEILGSHLGIDVRAEPALEEVDVGAWSGLTVHEVEAQFPEHYRRWVEWRVSGWEGGETYEALGRRVLAGVHGIARRHDGETVLAVTHGGPMRAALAAVSGLPLEEISGRFGSLGNCSVVRIAVRDGVIEAVD